LGIPVTGDPYGFALEAGFQIGAQRLQRDTLGHFQEMTFAHAASPLDQVRSLQSLPGNDHTWAEAECVRHTIWFKTHDAGDKEPGLADLHLFTHAKPHAEQQRLLNHGAETGRRPAGLLVGMEQSVQRQLRLQFQRAV